LFIRFLTFAICFVLISWAYLIHNKYEIHNAIYTNEKFLFALIIIFYYLAIYQLITEVLQFRYRGLKKYFSEIFNIFDIISIILSVTVMTIMLKRDFKPDDGFKSVQQADTGLIMGI